ncbi:hypothetical protein L227DRAFT_554758 [Lentinus tigrinus ALCF2SS1-6]|uniref:Protein-S-isoprenylcysteine O-methyltransferase n=1 Tax=Lentinus tigrinus ALCF2SS1-6 TaxID=1328759 RepID=A0A5C2RV52_9APHY|nr:hypothetical protein L227DRAFT_554758 [Lentinus tigrinus ALCF2SS1-6]
MATPLLKVPLLLSLSLWTYRGMTPPTRPSRPDEKARASVQDFLGSAPEVHRVAIGAAKVVFCTLAVAEATIVLIQQSSPIYNTLPLIPSISALSRNEVSLTPTVASLVGGLLGIAGGYIRESCHRTLGRFFTWEVAVRDDHRFITHGPYRIVRHPSYTGWLLMIVGNLLSMLSPQSIFSEMAETLFGRIVATCVTMVYMGSVCALALYRTRAEDAMLQKKFGGEWESWAKKTPYRLVPFLY